MRTETFAAAQEHVAARVARRGCPQGANGVWPVGREGEGSRREIAAQRLAVVLLAAGVALLYGPIAAATLADCWRDENYSHGVLVPLLVLVLLHQRHHDVVALSVSGSKRLRALAWTFLVAGCTGFVLGAAAAEEFAARASGVLVLMGLAGILGGPCRLRRYAPPLALLFGAIPLPYVLYYQIAFPLQLLSARAASGGLALLGLEVTRSGNVFEVGGHALEVVGACSGIRSMMTLCTLGFAAAVASRLGVRRGVLLTLAALPAAIAGNLLRLMVTSLLVVRLGPRATEGALHTAVGFASFAASVGLLAGVLALLRRHRPASSEVAAHRTRWPRPAKLAAWARALRPASPRTAWIAVAVLAATGAYGGFLRAHAAAPGQVPRLDALPLEFAGLAGEDLPLDDRVLDKLNPESFVFRSYRAERGGEIGLYVAYYRDPRQGAQIHSPLHCYPGAGWKVLRSEPLGVRDLSGQPTRMQRLLVEKGARRDVVVYWYDTRSGRLTSDFDLKFDLMRTALLHRPQDAAFVRWSTPLADEESLEAATMRLLSAVAIVSPQLELALPFGG